MCSTKAICISFMFLHNSWGKVNRSAWNDNIVGFILQYQLLHGTFLSFLSDLLKQSKGQSWAVRVPSCLTKRLHSNQDEFTRSSTGTETLRFKCLYILNETGEYF